jgi:nucleotide-binding universal stress UspA family protein
MTKKQSQVPSFSGAVVVGVDGHDTTQAALLWAAAEAGRRKTRLVIMTIQEAYTNDLPFGASVDETIAIADADTDVTARRAAQAARDAVPGLKVSTVRPEGQPARRLIKASKTAALVVVGSHGRHKRAYAALGTTASTTAMHAKCPVVVVHPDRSAAHAAGPAHVVVGVDGSRDSSLAIDAAADLAGKDGHVNVVNAWWFSMSESGSLAGGDLVEEEKIRARHARGVRNISVEGEPVTALVEQAKDADLLVVGARGRGGFGGLLLGSNALKALAASPVPVAVIHK